MAHGGGTGVPGPWGRGRSLTWRAVAGLAEGRRAAVQEVEGAPLFHLQDMGRWSTPAARRQVARPSSRLPSDSVGSEATDLDPPVALSITIGLGNSRSRYPSSEERLAPHLHPAAHSAGAPAIPRAGPALQIRSWEGQGADPQDTLVFVFGGRGCVPASGQRPVSSCPGAKRRLPALSPPAVEGPRPSWVLMSHF